MLAELLIGFAGLVIGALIGFFGDFYLYQRKEKFEAYKDVRDTLNKMYNDLIVGHSSIQKYYVENRDNDSSENILQLKDYHWKVMEIYKEFRIYFGNLCAYELQSAVYNYYFEFAKVEKDNKNLTEFYEIAYQALKDAYGLMLNDVKLGLASVKFLTEANDNLKIDKRESYLKYSQRLKDSLDKDLKAKENKQLPREKETPLAKAQRVVEERIKLFEAEFDTTLGLYNKEILECNKSK